MIIMIDYNTYSLPGNYEEPGKLSHLRLEYREIDGENRTPQYYKTYNTESQLTGGAMVQSDNINDN